MKDRMAIVTGASKGIGKAVALELAREGCRVVLCARGEEELEEAAGEVRKLGEALPVVADVTKSEEVERLVEETVDRFGGVDILVNNAGGIGSPSAFEEISDEEWMGVLDLNFLSAVRLTRAVRPAGFEEGQSAIVFGVLPGAFQTRRHHFGPRCGGAW